MSRSTLADANAQRPNAVCGLGAAWAHFSAKACGTKAHVIYDADAARPVYAAVTAAKVNDITAAQTMPIEADKVLRILCNDLDASAQEIADLYKRRWAIELFFRWIKQTLKIRHFLGISENAVRIQIAVALIVFLLLRMAQTVQNAVKR